jgi:hypothetical protein
MLSGMTTGQVVAVVWGAVAIVFGVFFVLQRDRISRAAREVRARRGGRVGPRTQSPGLMAAGGTFLVVAGAAVLVAGLTGALA